MKEYEAEYNHMIKEIYDMLPKKLFYKPHRSYVVNFEYIKSYSKANRIHNRNEGWNDI